jgi:prepilin-type N-terminal cleavage/methylation domain-containing protein
MGNNMMRPISKRPRRKQKGFTLIEMMIAILVILVGLVAVAQLVAASIFLNTANREDSTSMVIAQNEINQFAAQPLGSFTYTDTAGHVCTLGSSGTTGSFVGSPVATSGDNRQVIDFTQAAVSGYNFTMADPNDPYNANYEVRWAVYTFSGTSGKRFIVGVRRQGGNRPLLPVNLDTLVQK